MTQQWLRRLVYASCKPNLYKTAPSQFSCLDDLCGHYSTGNMRQRLSCATLVSLEALHVATGSVFENASIAAVTTVL